MAWPHSVLAYHSPRNSLTTEHVDLCFRIFQLWGLHPPNQHTYILLWARQLPILVRFFFCAFWAWRLSVLAGCYCKGEKKNTANTMLLKSWSLKSSYLGLSWNPESSKGSESRIWTSLDSVTWVKLVRYQILHSVTKTLQVRLPALC